MKSPSPSSGRQAEARLLGDRVTQLRSLTLLGVHGLIFEMVIPDVLCDRQERGIS